VRIESFESVSYIYRLLFEGISLVTLHKSSTQFGCTSNPRIAKLQINNIEIVFLVKKDVMDVMTNNTFHYSF
jgi:hypothetical protein